MPTFVFFGTGHFAEEVLRTFIEAGHVPAYLITSPDKPVGRHQIITPPPAKILAMEHGIPVLQPVKLRDEASLAELKSIIDTVDACVVADYGKILPQSLLDLSKNGFLNIHPSLLPLHRGPAPLQATILCGEKHTGVTIILMDALMDHGPIVAQVEEDVALLPCPVRDFSNYMAKKGADLLLQVLPDFVAGNINPKEQNHDAATVTKMIDKKDGEVLFDDVLGNNLKNVYLKYCAYKDWPEIFFMHEGKRVKIKEMKCDDGACEILRVTPEGKNEVAWSEYAKHHMQK
jgi:methionyl-tRNA formyltransferase